MTDILALIVLVFSCVAFLWFLRHVDGKERKHKRQELERRLAEFHKESELLVALSKTP